MRAVLPFLALAVSLAACQDDVSPKDIPGTYRSEYKGVVGILRIGGDGNYVRSEDSRAIAEPAIGGTWAFERSTPARPDTVVALDRFEPVSSYRAAHAGRAGWDAVVQRNWAGQIRLCYDEDAGYCYAKQ